MPWISKDALEHTERADTPKKQETWAKAANSRRKQCLAAIEGEPSDAQVKACDASAIKVANALVSNIKEQEPGGPEMCVCPDCDYEVEKERGVPCRSLECPKCGAALVAGVEQENAEEAEMPSKVRPDWKIEVDGGCVTIGELVTAWHELREQDDEEEWQLTETDIRQLITIIDAELKKRKAAKEKQAESAEVQEMEPASDEMSLEQLMDALFDSCPSRAGKKKGGWFSSVRSWVKSKGTKTNSLTGYRRRLVMVGTKMGMSFGEGEGLDASTLRGLLTEALCLLLPAAEVQEEPEAEAKPLSESATPDAPATSNAISVTGHAVRLVEAGTVAEGGSKPLIMEVYPIVPGWGNKQDSHYYGAEMLRKCAPVAFREVKMYETNHRPSEKSNRTWVSTIIETDKFADDGRPISRVGVHDPYFAAKAINLNELGLLHLLECSIWADGMAEKFEKDGRKGKNVVEILADPKPDVDWVTRAGAGGHARRLAESEETMSEKDEREKEKIEEAEPVKISEEAEPKDEGAKETTPPMLAPEQIEEILAITNLPDASKARLAEGDYPDEAALEKAVKGEIAYVKEITGSGRPFEQGPSTAPEVEPMTEEKKVGRFNKIMREVGAREVPNA